jgi:hypothetical protein
LQPFDLVFALRQLDAGLGVLGFQVVGAPLQNGRFLLQPAQLLAQLAQASSHRFQLAIELAQPLLQAITAGGCFSQANLFLLLLQAVTPFLQPAELLFNLG